MTLPAPTPSATIDALKEAAHLLNRSDLRATSESEARAFNAAERAVRDGIALIENPADLMEFASLDWTEGHLVGQPVTIGRGLGLKYHVAPMTTSSRWVWAVGDEVSEPEATRELAMAACDRDFQERLSKFIRPLAAIN
ncbi:hypothetical protein G6L37_00415 [Agrobacterium rubi]|nr:hypothetical protein [Agrobacterium rubi]NTF23852.1 hypothetical protein [Agrobacterium rubi]